MINFRCLPGLRFVAHVAVAMVLLLVVLSAVVVAVVSLEVSAMSSAAPAAGARNAVVSIDFERGTAVESMTAIPPGQVGDNQLTSAAAVQMAAAPHVYDAPTVTRVDASVTRIVEDGSPQVSAGVDGSAWVAAEAVGTGMTPVGSLVTPSGPGVWRGANESMSARASAYQGQIAGRPGSVYEVGGVKFDGFSNGVLLEAKGPGYSNFIRNGDFQPWFRGADALLDQAGRQVRAAGGTPIRWSVAEADAAAVIRNLLRDNNIRGIDVVHVAPR